MLRSRLRSLPPVTKDSLATFRTAVGTKLLVLVSSIVIAKAGGRDAVGTYAALQSAGLIGVVVADGGFSTLILRYYDGAGSSDLRAFRGVVKERAALTLIGSVLGGCLAVAVLHGNLAFRLIGATCVYTVAATLAQFLQALALSALGFSQGSRHYALGRVSGCVMFPAVLWIHGASRIALFALVIQTLVELLTAAIILRAIWIRIVPGGGRITSSDLSWRRAVPYGANAFVNLLINRSDSFLVGALSSTANAGLWAPASQLQNAVITFAYMAVSATTSHTSRELRRTGRVRGALHVLRSSMRAAVPATAVVSLLIAVPLPWIIPLVLGPGFGATVTISWVLLAFAPVAAAAGVTFMFLEGSGEPKLATRAWAIAAGACLVAHLIFTTRYGAYGAAGASSVRDPLLLGFGILGVRRSLKAPSDGAPELPRPD
jgi:O-antigen/teichoic acid export membrane protein